MSNIHLKVTIEKNWVYRKTETRDRHPSGTLQRLEKPGPGTLEKPDNHDPSGTLRRPKKRVTVPS